ncbi:hypothetical protein AGLY_012402 [Aphis glycines]|uniref:Uncharacterized protein n=1 Tax=Aphis glycines TaxID=307491 RepID=A0A6G0T9Y4_APHGL|nr:hypothetical protein AGLY_012402 [Aphis glycines]
MHAAGFCFNKQKRKKLLFYTLFVSRNSCRQITKKIQEQCIRDLFVIVYNDNRRTQYSRMFQQYNSIIIDMRKQKKNKINITDPKQLTWHQQRSVQHSSRWLATSNNYVIILLIARDSNATRSTVVGLNIFGKSIKIKQCKTQYNNMMDIIVEMVIIIPADFFFQTSCINKKVFSSTVKYVTTGRDSYTLRCIHNQ